MLRRSIAPVALVLLLAACTSPAQVAQRDEDLCARAGHKPNTDEYKNCLLDLETKRTVRRDSRHREMLERSSSPLSR